MPQTIRQRMGAAEWLMLVVLSVLWGASFFLVEIALRGLPPLTLVALRVAIAAPVLWAVALVRGAGPSAPVGVWPAFAVMGLLNNVLPFSLIVWGQTIIDSGLASILNATAPLFTVLVAGLALADERLTAARLFAVLLGFAGVAIMTGPAALGGIGADVLAQLAVLAAALCYAVAGVFGRRFSALGVDPVVTAAGQVTAAALIMVPLALLAERPFELAVPRPQTWLAVVALAYVLYFRVLASSGATNLLLVTFLVPVSAVLLGVTVLHERLNAAHLAGMALIGAGLAIIDGRPWARLRRLRRRPDARSS